MSMHRLPLPKRALVPLETVEALRLLASVEYGRIVFTHKALPAIRPVNHVIDNGEIFLRTRIEAAVSEAIQNRGYPTVVAYEADQLDPETHLGWSVVVTGFARTVTDSAELARLEQLLRPWVNMSMDTATAIRPEIVTGFRLTEHQGDPLPGHAPGQPGTVVNGQ